MSDPIKTAYQVELEGRCVNGDRFYWRSKAVFVDKEEAENWKDEVLEAQCKRPDDERDDGLMVDRDTVTAKLIPLDVFL